MEALFDFVKATNVFLMEEKEPNKKLCKYALNKFLAISQVLTLLQEERGLDEDALKKLAAEYNVEGKTGEEIVEKLLAIRKKAREEKNYKVADEIREKLKKVGIEIEDVGKETKWRIR